MSTNFLIIGDDNYIREKEESKIKNKFLSPGEIDLNFSAYTPEKIEEIMDSLHTMPFLADNRVVLIKAAENLTEEFEKSISLYLENPYKTSILVVSAGNNVKKTSFFKNASKNMAVILADKPTEEDIKKWIPSFFKKEGIEISHQAVNLIVELKGNDTQAVKIELEKIAAYSGGKRIEEEDVRTLIGRSVKDTVFDLVDAINRKSSVWVFKILNDLYDQKKQPQEIIGYLAWYIRIMQKINLFSGKGYDVQNISRELGYSMSYTKKLIDESKKYPIKRINKWLNELLDADRDIKTGKNQPDTAIETLLVNLIN